MESTMHDRNCILLFYNSYAENKRHRENHGQFWLNKSDNCFGYRNFQEKYKLLNLNK